MDEDRGGGQGADAGEVKVFRWGQGNQSLQGGSDPALLSIILARVLRPARAPRAGLAEGIGMPNDLSGQWPRYGKNTVIVRKMYSLVAGQKRGKNSQEFVIPRQDVISTCNPNRGPFETKWLLKRRRGHQADVCWSSHVKVGRRPPLQTSDGNRGERA